MLALSTTAFAGLILLVLGLGWLVYALMNQGAARKELGSEIELAANRKPYYSDEELEGKRLELVQFLGVLLLVVLVIGLPLYWVFEPTRQAGAVEQQEETFIGWGEGLFDTTANGGFNCAGCHGGLTATGGNAAGTVTDPLTNEVRAVNFIAPALNTVLYRFDETELTYIINYGRPGTPMSAWGLVGGGPLNSQQVETLVAYIRSIQVPREGCDTGEADDPNCPTGHLPAAMQEEIDAEARRLVEAGTYDTYGQALFNLGLSGGAYSCARCHTEGWNYGEPGESGAGRLGWNLTGGRANMAFPDETALLDFLSEGTVQGAGYGQGGQGTGRMPGFGSTLTDEQIEAIADYIRGL